jgi:hypothetical protein
MATIPVIRAWKAVAILWNVVQQIPPPSILYDPPSPPQITLLDAAGNAQIIAQTTVKLRTGVYSYTYITPTEGPLGIWSAWLDVLDANGRPNDSVNSTGRQKATPIFQSGVSIWKVMALEARRIQAMGSN